MSVVTEAGATARVSVSRGTTLPGTLRMPSPGAESRTQAGSGNVADRARRTTRP